jgi:hypothetical protein
MSVQYTVTISEAEDKALSYVAISQQDWIDNAVHERCRMAMEEIIKICVEKCLENNIQIPGTKDDIVMLAFENQWLATAVESISQQEIELN